MADVKKIATRDSYGNMIAALGAEHDDILVLDADLAGATKTSTFLKAFPERHFNCGIAEAGMIVAAAGASTMGLVPFASTSSAGQITVIPGMERINAKSSQH